MPEVALLKLPWKGLVDEDECQERHKAFLDEAGDVADEKTEVKRDTDEEDDENPEANPESKCQIVPTKLPKPNQIHEIDSQFQQRHSISMVILFLQLNWK